MLSSNNTKPNGTFSVEENFNLAKSYKDQGYQKFESFCDLLNVSNDINSIKTRIYQVIPGFYNEVLNSQPSGYLANEIETEYYDKATKLLDSILKRKLDQDFRNEVHDILNETRDLKPTKDDYQLEILSHITSLYGSSQDAELKNFLKITLIKFLTEIYPPSAHPITTKARYGDTTWLMLLADSGITVPSLEEFVKNHPESLFASIKHEYRKENDPDYYGFSVVTIAARRKNYDFINTVIQGLRNANNGFHYLHLISKFLSCKNLVGDYEGNTPLMYICGYGDPNQTLHLINNKASVVEFLNSDRDDFPGYSALSFAMHGIVDAEAVGGTPNINNYLMVIHHILSTIKPTLTVEAYENFIKNSYRAFANYANKNSDKNYLANFLKVIGTNRSETIIELNNLTRSPLDASNSQKSLGFVITSNLHPASDNKRNIEEYKPTPVRPSKLQKRRRLESDNASINNNNNNTMSNNSNLISYNNNVSSNNNVSRNNNVSSNNNTSTPSHIINEKDFINLTKENIHHNINNTNLNKNNLIDNEQVNPITTKTLDTDMLAADKVNNNNSSIINQTRNIKPITIYLNKIYRDALQSFYDKNLLNNQAKNLLEHYINPAKKLCDAANLESIKNALECLENVLQATPIDRQSIIEFANMTYDELQVPVYQRPKLMKNPATSTNPQNATTVTSASIFANNNATLQPSILASPLPAANNVSTSILNIPILKRR